MKILNLVLNHKIVSSVMVVGLVGATVGGYVIYNTGTPVEVSQQSNLIIDEEPVIEEDTKKPVVNEKAEPVQSNTAAPSVADPAPAKQVAPTEVKESTENEEAPTLCDTPMRVYSVKTTDEVWEKLVNEHILGSTMAEKGNMYINQHGDRFCY